MFILQQLLVKGHRVRRALVRTPAKLRDNLAPLDLDVDGTRIEVISGDTTDAVAVQDAANGCDRTIRAAATYAYRRRDAERMLRENMTGTATV